MSHPEADRTRWASSGGEMTDRHSDRIANKAPILVIARAGCHFGCVFGGNELRLFGLQCGAPTAEQESKAADDEARVGVLRHALGIAQACNTQVNGENSRARRLSSEFDGGQSRPAAGKEGIKCLLRRTVLENYGFARWSSLYPAWVWAFFILLANCTRHFALDTCQNWNA